jgi:hypothetical protein
LAPSTIEGIYRLGTRTSAYDIEIAQKRILSESRVREAFHPQKPEGGASLLTGESVGSIRAQAVQKANETQFAEDIVAYRQRPSYNEYLKTYNPRTLLQNFDAQLGFQDRLQQQRKTVRRVLLTGAGILATGITYAFLNFKSQAKGTSVAAAASGMRLAPP